LVVRVLLRRSLLVLLLMALLGASSAHAGPSSTELMPGVTYTREVTTVAGREVVLHIVTAPKPGGPYALAPTIADGTVVGRETVTGMQQRLSETATLVGVNGDLFNYQDGSPSGILMRDSVLLSRPFSGRSSLGVGIDGLLRVARVGFFGKWTVGDSKGVIGQLNRPLGSRGVGLFTSAWGESTPVAKKAVDLVIQPFPAASVNGPLEGTVVQATEGGGTTIPSDGVVLQGTGQAGNALAAAGAPGTPVVVRLDVKPWWEEVANAIGGGPSLVEGGRVAVGSGEEFSSSQLTARAPRTAVGQRANGEILLVAVDGRSTSSAGVTTVQLAEEMVRLGAETAMALDSGGSTALAFDGTLLSTPSDGGERQISNALMVYYYGIYAPQPSAPVVSPNGDGVDDREIVSFKVVRPSAVEARLVGPGDHVFYKDESQQEPGSYPFEVAPEIFKEGTWRWVVRATDAEGIESKAERSFIVNNTLGFLELSKQTLKVTKKRGAEVVTSFKVAKRARVTVEVQNGAGRVVRTLSDQRRKPGAFQLVWDARNADGTVVVPGSYRIVVRATNDIGAVELAGNLTVRRKR
jgi:Phosphodiester glycosidase/FlgD Ig-like domain